MNFTPTSSFQPFKALIMPALTRTPELTGRVSQELTAVQRGLLEGKIQGVVISEGSEVLGFMTLESYADNLHVRTIVGSFKPGWLDEVIPLLVRVAKSRDKSIIKCAGRKGWNKLLKPYGFEPNGKYLRKML